MTRRWRIPLIAALALLVIVVPSAIRFYTDWLWFGETGYRDVFVSTLAAEGTLGRSGHGFGLGRPPPQPPSGDADVFTARAGASDPRRTDSDHRRSPARADDRHGARRRRCAALRAVYASGQWQVWLLFRHAQPFGDVDPVLGKDVSFYVFRLPFLDVLRGYLFALVAARRCRYRRRVRARRGGRTSI